MGSGKSTVGEALAELLNWKFVDLDSEIVRHERLSISEIFRLKGEARFREIETQRFEETFLQMDTPVVVALGGGTFIQPANREILRARRAVTVYLDADFDLLLSRCCQEEPTRPLLQDRKRFRELFDERQATYLLADASVQVAGRTPGEIASEIASMVPARKAGRI